MGKKNYSKVKSSEINEVAKEDLQKATLMVLGNIISDEAESRVNGTKEHIPLLHKDGFSISVQTPQGVVGLWSCWLRNKFYVGYPKNIQIKDETIMNTLGVKKAVPVQQENGSRLWAKFYGPQLVDGQGRVWIESSDFN